MAVAAGAAPTQPCSNRLTVQLPASGLREGALTGRHSGAAQAFVGAAPAATAILPAAKGMTCLVCCRAAFRRWRAWFRHGGRGWGRSYEWVQRWADSSAACIRLAGRCFTGRHSGAVQAFVGAARAATAILPAAKGTTCLVCCRAAFRRWRAWFRHGGRGWGRAYGSVAVRWPFRLGVDCRDPACRRGRCRPPVRNACPRTAGARR